MIDKDKVDLNSLKIPHGGLENMFKNTSRLAMTPVDAAKHQIERAERFHRSSLAFYKGHTNSVYLFSSLHNYFSCMNMIISGIALLLSAQLKERDSSGDDDDNWFSSARLIDLLFGMNIALITIGAIVRVFNYEKRARKHESAATIFYYIAACMNKVIEKRRNTYDFLLRESDWSDLSSHRSSLPSLNGIADTVHESVHHGAQNSDVVNVISEIEKNTPPRWRRNQITSHMRATEDIQKTLDDEYDDVGDILEQVEKTLYETRDLSVTIQYNVLYALWLIDRQTRDSLKMKGDDPCRINRQASARPCETEIESPRPRNATFCFCLLTCRQFLSFIFFGICINFMHKILNKYDYSPDIEETRTDVES